MTFKRDNFTPYANNGKKGRCPILWVYYNENDDTVTSVAYFPYGEVSNGDQITVISKDYTTQTHYHITVDNDKRTATAVANS